MKKIEEDILHTYAATGSVWAAAKESGISACKARKILISHCAFEGSEIADKVADLQAQGLPADAIAERLKTSVKHINNYMPYTKSIYGDEPSENALKIRRSRAKKGRE